ncbi:hypothetical protein E2C01_096215 [Portunus trituberculatus]|uniref:Uncharacterized protein n=1 Tax=Portunus trituberculatus TaxID=210409 RepID=A0A5B7JS33_PORTR|nr:hypothetical protein [Portunus trituberculatus]
MAALPRLASPGLLWLLGTVIDISYTAAEAPPADTLGRTRRLFRGATTPHLPSPSLHLLDARPSLHPIFLSFSHKSVPLFLSLPPSLPPTLRRPLLYHLVLSLTSLSYSSFSSLLLRLRVLPPINKVMGIVKQKRKRRGRQRGGERKHIEKYLDWSSFSSLLPLFLFLTFCR